MKIILVGPGAGGKDHLKKRFLERGFKQSVSYTTRPPRKNEIDGSDYHFVNEDTFRSMIDVKDFREWNVFGDQKWYYGTTVREFNDASLFVMTPSGIKALTPTERKKCFVIYIDVPVEVRRERLNARQDADGPERRIKTDIEDFKDFTDYDMRVTNPDF
jgi:guanylate kinase